MHILCTFWKFHLTIDGAFKKYVYKLLASLPPDCPFYLISFSNVSYQAYSNQALYSVPDQKMGFIEISAIAVNVPNI